MVIFARVLVSMSVCVCVLRVRSDDGGIVLAVRGGVLCLGTGACQHGDLGAVVGAVAAHGRMLVLGV